MTYRGRNARRRAHKLAQKAADEHLAIVKAAPEIAKKAVMAATPRIEREYEARHAIVARGDTIYLPERPERDIVMVHMPIGHAPLVYDESDNFRRLAFGEFETWTFRATVYGIDNPRGPGTVRWIEWKRIR